MTTMANITIWAIFDTWRSHRIVIVLASRVHAWLERSSAAGGPVDPALSAARPLRPARLRSSIHIVACDGSPAAAALESYAARPTGPPMAFHLADPAGRAAADCLFARAGP